MNAFNISIFVVYEYFQHKLLIEHRITNSSLEMYCFVKFKKSLKYLQHKHYVLFKTKIYLYSGYLYTGQYLIAIPFSKRNFLKSPLNMFLIFQEKF